MRRLLVLTAMGLIMSLVPVTAASAHGTCSANALEPVMSGFLPAHAYGSGTYNCSDGHAKIWIKVELLRQDLITGWHVIASATNTKLQARNISATADYRCIPNPGPPIGSYFKTRVTGKAYNASGALVSEHTKTDTSGLEFFLDCL
jgi:hypothetical protein